MSRQRHNQNMLSTTTPSLSKDEALVCTREKDNFLQFARLIMVGCNDLLRELFNYLCPPEMLHERVNSLVEKLPRLNQNEHKRLYPSTRRHVTSDDFDISLLFKLLNVIDLEQPDGGWDKLPKKTDHKISDELERIKYYRDEICHESYHKEISNDLFLEVWEYIRGAMIRIAECLPRGREWWELRIDEFSRAPLTLAEEKLAEELNQWYLHDVDVKKLLLEVKTDVKDIEKRLKERQLTEEDKELSEETSPAGPVKKRQLTEEDKELSEETSPAGPVKKCRLTEEDEDKELSEETSPAGPVKKRQLTEEDEELSEETSPAGPVKRQAEKRTNALHVAAKNGNIEMIKLVLRHFDVNSIDESGETPLMLAAAHGKDAAVQMLKQNGADAHLECPFGRCLLHFAAQGGNPDILRYLLSFNLDVDHRNCVGVTPLATAAIYGNEHAFNLLLEQNADLSSITEDGYNVLHFAAFGGSVPIISKLISLGFDKDLEDPFGITPLTKAAENNKYEAVRYLLSIKAK